MRQQPGSVVSLVARSASVVMVLDLFDLKFWECGRVMKMERTGDSFWLSRRNCLLTDSQNFAVSLSGHQWKKHSAVISTFGGGKTGSEFSFHRKPSNPTVCQNTAFKGMISLLDASLWDVRVGSFEQRASHDQI